MLVILFVGCFGFGDLRCLVAVCGVVLVVICGVWCAICFLGLVVLWFVGFFVLVWICSLVC